jgi:hypothetical protein
VVTISTAEVGAIAAFDAGSDLAGDEVRERVAAMAPGRLEAEVAALSQRLAAGTYELLVLVGEVDARGSWAVWGALSCAAWLADIADIEVCTARTQVRVAKAMRDHPALDAAMRSGVVSYAKARVLAACLTVDNADALLAIAERTPAGRLGAAVAAWSQRHEDAHVIEARQQEARSVSWRTEPDGMVTITSRLTPVEAGAVCAQIDTRVMRADAPAGASLAQQRADAFVATLTGGGPVTAELVVHVRADGNTLADGTPLSDHAVAQLLPEAFVSLLIHDGQRQPIDASPRRRFPTRRQRRVLDQLQGQCQHPGCHATAFLQYDHIKPYTQDGPTVIANLQRLCGPHNRARHEPAGAPRAPRAPLA